MKELNKYSFIDELKHMKGIMITEIGYQRSYLALKSLITSAFSYSNKYCTPRPDYFS